MRRVSFVLSVLICFAPYSVHASCGSATCSLATHIDALGLTTTNGWQLDLRYEYINQDQLRSGTQEVAPEFVDGEHTEKYTKNNNYVTTLDYSVDNRWGLSLQLPYVQREHYHIFVDGADTEDETWDFDSFGDARILGRYLLSAELTEHSQSGVQLGVKLPTGKTDMRNAAGELAERSLQPGTGTTDLIIGYFHTRDLKLFDDNERGFMQLQAQAALDEHDGFRPGNQYRVNAGLVFNPAATLSPIVQFNLLSKGRDHGENAEPADSGGDYLWLSPGFSMQLNHNVRVYGFLQYPLYQRVNGTQLTSDWTASIGISWL